MTLDDRIEVLEDNIRLVGTEYDEYYIDEVWRAREPVDGYYVKMERCDLKKGSKELIVFIEWDTMEILKVQTSRINPIDYPVEIWRFE